MAPAFYIHPKSIKASLGDTVVFECAVQAVSRPSITWLKDGMAFKDASDKTMIQENTNETSELRIISVSERDIGHYTCLAIIQNVQVSSREAMLSLKGKRNEQLPTMYFCKRVFDMTKAKVRQRGVQIKNNNLILSL